MATGSEATVLITASATFMNATTGNTMKRIRIAPCGENSQVSGSAAVPGGLVGNPKSQKKISVGIFEYILASMLKMFLNI